MTPEVGPLPEDQRDVGPEEPSPGPPKLPGSSRFLLWSTAVAFFPVAGVLALAGLELLHAFYLGGLLVLLPGLAVAQVPLVRDEPMERVPVYVGSGVFLVLLAVASGLLGEWKVGSEGLGLVPFPETGPLLAWAGVLVAGAGVVTLGFHFLGRWLGIPESPILARLLPRTGGEQSLFAGLSLAAGLGEELAYRGYAITVLTPLLGSAWGAAALTSAVFGGLHAYQGPLGILRTAALGFLLAAGFLLSGSLWPGIVAHATIDLLGGLVFGERLLRLDEG